MKTLRKTVIAHVDDDPIILDMIRLILSQNNKFELKSYNTGEEFPPQFVSHLTPRS